MPRSSEEDYYHERDSRSEGPSRRRGTRVAEYEDIEIDRRRRGDRETEVLREDYARSPTGPVVIREEEVIEEKGRDPHRRRKHRDRHHGSDDETVIVERKVKEYEQDRRGVRREREVIEEDATSSRSSRDRDRRRNGDRGKPIRQEEIVEEVRYRRRDEPEPEPEREVVREEVVHRPRERSPPPMLAREREEWVFSRKRSPSPEPEPEPVVTREEIVIRQKERERDRPRDYREEDITIHERERERDPPRGYREEEVRIRERERERPRDYREEDITIRERERDRPGDYREESITIRERERARPRDYREEDITIRERDRDRRRDYREEDIIIQDRERDRPRDRGYREEEISIRERERDPPRPKPVAGHQDEEVIIRREETGPGASREEIVIRREEEKPKPPSPPPPPEVIKRPPIIQEVITHHRHIDHGYERVAPPLRDPIPIQPPRSPSPRSVYDEVEIRRRGERNGQRYDEDIRIDTRRRSPSPPPVIRMRPPSPRSGGYAEVDIRRRGERNGERYDDEIRIDTRQRQPERALAPYDDEAGYYARRADDRAYIGEGYNGATRDWAIVDVPPGTSRVKMDGVGGTSQEVTWQRYNGVRRSKFVVEDDVVEERGLDVGRRFVAQRSKEDRMWTEITKDLVVKEAITSRGYEFEETEYFYYVFEYLRYEDVLELVEISDDIRRRRSERVRGIEIERQMSPPEPEPPRRAIPWYDEEKIVEREVFYEPRALPPPAPSPRPRERREVRERVYIRD